MAIDLEQKRLASAPSGLDTLAVRERYLRRRRRFSGRSWITLWVSLGALIGWLFIAGFSLLGH